MPSTDADAPVIAPRSSFEQNSTLTPASAATSVNLAIFGAGILGAAVLVPFDGLVRPSWCWRSASSRSC